MTAAAARKLQKEIENVLKKVDDGLNEFEDYWEQAMGAGNGPQKERLGEELKKSINKLQRLRAQIREWIGQGVQIHLKDKLEDARKKIENDMQRFKEFERELKTKAFSTCALARQDELELGEAEKIKYQDWLSATIQTLNDQKDQFDADIEILDKKKHPSADDKTRQAQMKEVLERHRWHIKKLEQVLRGVDNDMLDLTELAVVRETVDIYLETHNDPDCYHDEALYDTLDLEAFEVQEQRSEATPSDAEEKTPAAGDPPACSGDEEPASNKSKAKEKEKRRKDDKKDKKKEEREKKASQAGGANTPANSTSKASNAPRANDAKAPAQEPKAQAEPSALEKLDLER